jgi:hypothetical protein
VACASLNERENRAASAREGRSHRQDPKIDSCFRSTFEIHKGPAVARPVRDELTARRPGQAHRFPGPLQPPTLSLRSLLATTITRIFMSFLPPALIGGNERETPPPPRSLLRYGQAQVSIDGVEVDGGFTEFIRDLTGEWFLRT